MFPIHISLDIPCYVSFAAICVESRMLCCMKVVFIIAGLEAYRISLTFVMIWAPQTDNVTTDLGQDKLAALVAYGRVVIVTSRYR